MGRLHGGGVERIGRRDLNLSASMWADILAVSILVFFRSRYCLAIRFGYKTVSIFLQGMHAVRLLKA